MPYKSFPKIGEFNGVLSSVFGKTNTESATPNEVSRKSTCAECSLILTIRNFNGVGSRQSKKESSRLGMSSFPHWCCPPSHLSRTTEWIKEMPNPCRTFIWIAIPRSIEYLYIDSVITVKTTAMGPITYSKKGSTYSIPNVGDFWSFLISFSLHIQRPYTSTICTGVVGVQFRSILMAFKAIRWNAGVIGNWSTKVSRYPLSHVLRSPPFALRSSLVETGFVFQHYFGSPTTIHALR